MNYLYLLLITIVVFLVMLGFYKFGNKSGLFLYISFMSSLLSVIMFKSIDVLSFEFDLGIPFVMGIFVCSNIIIQRYGIDEIKDIIKSFVFPYIVTIIILCLVSLVSNSEYNIVSSNAYNALFGYNLDNLRMIVGGFFSIGFSLWYNAYIYYYIRKNKNKYLISNIGSMLVIQFLESIVFVIVSYIGLFEFNILFGMVVVRYLFKIFLGIIGLLPFIFVLKMKVD